VKPPRSLALACFALAVLGAPLGADEGMWTFDNPPLARWKDVYGFTPTREWLDRVRLSSVRFMDGGSGSFVSPDGLMLTNHHVGFQCIQNISSETSDFIATGFYAGSRDREPACPGYEVNLVTSIENVTARVLGAVAGGMDDKAARAARSAEIGRIENECASKTGLRCDMVTLYQGAEYHLYRYKKFNDVRLVFAPEEQIAFFGGDPDNFTFPRHDLDIALFRAYENGKPVKPAAYLPWSTAGVKDGELVFVSGNPGSTSRLKTMVELQALREFAVPTSLKFLERRLKLLGDYDKRGPEQARRARSLLRSYENSQKAYIGRLGALEDASAMAGKAAAEKQLRAKAGEAASAWDAVAAAQQKANARFLDFRYVTFNRAPALLGIASQIVRYSAETKKPNEQRLTEYVDAGLPQVENAMYSKAPLYDDFEELLLADWLADAASALGPSHPFVKATLAGRAPADVARQAVAGTNLKDVAARKALVDGGPAAVAASQDPMIVLARAIDAQNREVRRFFEDEVDAAILRAHEKIAHARWNALGKTIHPDATFTLRLSYGVVKGFAAEGTRVAPFTTFHGLYDRWASWGGKEPWSLPPRWLDKKSLLELETKLNFVSTADIIGGNSGSPTLNRAGELVGVIFDGNIESLALDYYFSEDVARAVSVDSRGILEALRKVYGASALADELAGR
jgi:hypothetical protein